MVNKHVPSILSGLLKNTEESRYARMIYAAIFLLLVLGLRLFYMQVIQGGYYKEEADGNRIRYLPMQAMRGVMYDRNGLILAGSRSAYSVVMPVDRKGNTLSDEALSRLSQLLHVPTADIKKKIEDNKLAFGAIYLANDVGIDVATQIEEKKDEFPGIEIEVNPLRVYPLGNAGAQVLGYVGEAGPDDGCKCQKRRRHLSASLLQGKKASNPRPTVLEREPNLFLLGLLKSLIFLCSMN